MAKFAAIDYKISVAGTDFSTNLNSVELSQEADEVETTAFGQNFRTRIGGLKTGSITLNFMQDFGSGSVDAILNPLLGTIATVIIQSAASTVSATQPKYTAECLVTQYSPFASSVGDIATLSVTWPTTGTITRGTSA
jgi:hypothetical protein